MCVFGEEHIPLRQDLHTEFGLTRPEENKIGDKIVKLETAKDTKALESGHRDELP